VSRIPGKTKQFLRLFFPVFVQLPCLSYACFTSSLLMYCYKTVHFGFEISTKNVVITAILVIHVHLPALSKGVFFSFVKPFVIRLNSICVSCLEPLSATIISLCPNCSGSGERKHRNITTI